LQLRWELVGDSIAHDWGASRAAFTLTNRGTKPLPPTGWAIYFNALHSADTGSVGSGFIIEDVIADLHRLAPGASFAGLAPGASIRIPYVTGLLLNRSFVPQRPYIVFDGAMDVGVPLNDYVARPFERPPQWPGHDPRPGTPAPRCPLVARCSLRSPVSAQLLARAHSPRSPGPAGHSRGGRSPLRLSRIPARRRPQLSSEARRAAHPRPHRPLQAQCLPPPSH